MNRRSFLALLGAAAAAPAVAIRALRQKPAREITSIIPAPDWPITMSYDYAAKQPCPVPGCNGDMRGIKGIPDVTGHQGPHIFKMSSSAQDFRMLYGESGIDWL